MFRIRISEKFNHVLTRLQKMVISSYKANPVPLPRNIVLEDIDQNVSPGLRTKLDSVYHEKEITVVVTFKHSENNVISLLGIARRSWEEPTLEYDQALLHGIAYKGFTLALAVISNPSVRANGRFDNICEILHISVTNLQMKKMVETADNGFWWCNWILTLPAPYDDQESDVVLPQWMSDRSVKEAVNCQSYS